MKQALEILKRRKWLFIVPFTIVFAIPVIYSFFFMRSYEANSLVWLDSNASITSVLKESVVIDESEQPIQQEAGTLQQLLKSRAFLTKVIAQTPLRARMNTPKRRERTIAYVRKNLYTEVVGPNSLRIGFYGRSPGEAVTIATVTTTQFLDWVRGAARQQNDRSTEFFDQKAEMYASELESARAELQEYKEDHPETQQLEIRDRVLSAPDITVAPAVQLEFQSLQAQVESAQKMHESSLTDLANTRLVASAQEERFLNGLRIVDEPIQPTSFAKKRLLLFDFLALMVAIIVGATAVIMSELTDRTLRSERDVNEVLELPVLTQLPHSSQSGRQA